MGTTGLSSFAGSRIAVVRLAGSRRRLRPMVKPNLGSPAFHVKCVGACGGSQTEEPELRGRVVRFCSGQRRIRSSPAPRPTCSGKAGLNFSRCAWQFSPSHEGLRALLRSALMEWAETHREDFKRRDGLAGIPSEVGEDVRRMRAMELLRRAVAVCFEKD
jgi:hypothetical protein